MSCPRCWQIIGESLKCRDHGGEDAWTAQAYKLKPKPVEIPPEDCMNPWYDFLDDGVAALRVVP